MLAVQAGIGIAVLMQPGDLLLALSDHLVAVAELQGVELASGNASRRHAMGHAVGATRAFVDDGLVEKPVGLVARDIERAGAVAVLAADALVLVDLHETGLLVAHERAAGAHRSARGVGAMLACATAERPLHRLDLAIALKLVEGDDQTRVTVKVDRVLMRAGPLSLVRAQRARQVVPRFAGNLAALAGGALGGIEIYSLFSHVNPPYAFSISTRNALYSGVNEFGSPTLGVRSLTTSPVPYRSAQPKWWVKPT